MSGKRRKMRDDEEAMWQARGPGARLTMDKNAAGSTGEEASTLQCNAREASTLLVREASPCFCYSAAGQASDDQATQPCGQHLASSLAAAAAGIYWEMRGGAAS